MKTTPKLNMINMAEVEATEVEWLFYPYIPYGKLTILQGDPGDGKTTVILQLIAKLTKGEPLEEIITNNQLSTGEEPEESEVYKRNPITVIYQTAEDGLSDTIKPRLLAAGADCEKVLVIDESDETLTMADRRLEMALEETGARLIVLDPLQGYLGPGIDMYRANEIRPVMMSLSRLAERYHCAIVLVGHLLRKQNPLLFIYLKRMDLNGSVNMILPRRIFYVKTAR